ncbi:uncharacterized protein L201_008080 [Kwoniella dendrophila CBS 6074]|uniref:Methionyl-tRNA formyltransferase n=1 Tax=Kwoniella dendrophila CBS 6074 TaxID=1295534 RepID=A0AAX4K7J8_9TREE
MITSTSSSPPLGPLTSIPSHCEPLKQFRILLLVTSINSFAQRVISYLQYLGFEQVSVQLATSDEDMLNAAESWEADIVLCPFLTKKLPESIYSQWITLVVHPGPPGDAGPSSLDWVLMGDDGTITDSAEALDTLVNKSTADRESTQRSHWGAICFQANEELDGGAVWAWEQYKLPRIGSITKAQIYQGEHSIGAMSATIHALLRVYEQTAGMGLDKKDWLKALPKQEWSTHCVSLQKEFLGGNTLDRPLLQSTKRRPNFDIHTAEDILRILNASDSQPGSMLNPLTDKAKSSLFAYGAHLHKDLSTIPASLYTSLGYESFSAIPNGTIIATRQGAIFIKTRQANGTSAGIWITHGRVPRGKDKPIDPKISMVDAIQAAGHGEILESVKEWEQNTWLERKGEWQEVFVRSVETETGIAQLVYWNFYNGAFTTSNCQYLLKALQWATAEERGNVKVLALMGGNYFSNGIALNTIEDASSPGAETWANINAIDDIVSFLVGDISPEVPEFLKDVKPLSQKGIATIACVRGNAAAGGVAFAAACDVVVASRGVVFNPAYRGMGLHGSELHSYSYLKRCGPIHAAEMLRSMKPINSSLAHKWGLVDIELGASKETLPESESLFIEFVRSVLDAKTEEMVKPTSSFRCAPWCRSVISEENHDESLIETLCENKQKTYLNRDFPPLLHYRNEELSQMLLDCFHPIRSKRYHSRRYKFIRKTKASSTPTRYMLHAKNQVDEEDTKEFDNVPDWKRGDEWNYVQMEIPESMKTSEHTRINMFYGDDQDEEILVDEITPPVPEKVEVKESETDNQHIHIAPQVERKLSEAPTLLSMPSLSAQPMSPTLSNASSAEGPYPTTPLMESPPRKESTIMTQLPTSTSMTNNASNSNNNTQSKRLSLFRSHSSQIPQQTTAIVDSRRMFDEFGKNNNGNNNNTKMDKKDKKGTFRTLKKRVKNALKALGQNNNDDNLDKKSKLSSSTSSSPSNSSPLSKTKPLPSNKNINSQSMKSPSKTQAQAQTGTVKSSTTTNNVNTLTQKKQENTSTNNQDVCEWPCLTNGGEGDEEIGQNQQPNQIVSNRPLVQEVA